MVPPEKLRAYQTDPELQNRLKVYSADGVYYVSFNLAMPPFDDIHVRKAFNWIFDKEGFRQLRGGETTGELAGHNIINSITGNINAEYDPYATPNGAGDVEKAKEEMAQSKTATATGVRRPSCEGILTMTDREDPYPEADGAHAAVPRADRHLLDVKELERPAMYNKCNDMNEQVASARTWVVQGLRRRVHVRQPAVHLRRAGESCQLQRSRSVGGSALGWGYDATEVPSVDDKAAECTATGDDRVQCWAEIDQH